jgi:hypothetical protein
MFDKRFGRSLGAMALAFGLLACKPLAPAGGGADLPAVGQARVDEIHAACVKSGGSFLPESGAFICVTVPKDAGKSCRKASDCESACLARSGTCAPVKPLRGCEEILTESGIAVRQCIE